MTSDYLAPPTRSTEQPSTGDLLAAAQQGSQDAWAALYRRYRTMLLVAMRLRMHGVPSSTFDREDILQSAFLSAWTDFDRFGAQGERSFRRWLTTIVLNNLRNRLRSEAAEQRALSHSPAGSGRQAERDPLADSAFNPLTQAQRVEEKERLLEAIAELDEDDQEILSMRFFEGLSFERVAAILGCSRPTAYQRFETALQRLQKRVH